MPKITAYGTIFRDWEGLLGAVASNAGSLPNVESLRAALEAQLAKTKELKVQQEDLRGKSQKATEDLQQAVDDGREAARKLRAHVVSAIGSKTELLKVFGIPPTKRRTKKAKSQELKSPKTPPATKTPDNPPPAAETPKSS